MPERYAMFPKNLRFMLRQYNEIDATRSVASCEVSVCVCALWQAVDEWHRRRKKGPNENKNESRNSSLEPTTQTTSKVEREEVNFQNYYYYFVKVVLSQQFFELFMCLVALRFRFIVRHIPIWQTNDFEMSFSRPHCRVSTVRIHTQLQAKRKSNIKLFCVSATRVGEVCA